MEDLSTILEIFGEAQGFGHGAALREFSSKNGFRALWTDDARYAAAKAASACPKCNRPLEGRVVCRSCCKKIAKRASVRGEEHASAGRCPRCGGEHDSNKTWCSKCLSDHAGYRSSRRKRMFAAGLCYCGAPRDGDKVRCVPCGTAKAAKARAKRKARAT